MRVRFHWAALSLLLIALLVPSSSVNAATPTTTGRGLLISPLRSYENVDAGKQLSRSFSVVNQTDKPLTVQLSVESFSVADPAYNYKFDKQTNDWIKLKQTSATIQPGKSLTAAYTITVPAGTAPGGHYYTLLASANLDNLGLATTVRAASLLYLTVNGNLVRTSIIEKATAPWIVISPRIPYHLDIKNTGNIHYFAYFTARLNSLFYANAPAGASNLLMPNATRHIEGSLSSPLLPGIYKLTYGYKTDAGDTQQKVQYLLLLPPWFLAAIALAGILYYRFRQRSVKPTDS